jgi:hypothetical protein
MCLDMIFVRCTICETSLVTIQTIQTMRVKLLKPIKIVATKLI